MVRKSKSDERQTTTTELLGMQRWEDEGGQRIEDNDSSPDQISIQLAPTHARRRIPSLRWDQSFVIQPFHPGNGMILIREKYAK